MWCFVPVAVFPPTTGLRRFVIGICRPLAFRGLVRSVLSGPACGGGGEGWAGGLAAGPSCGSSVQAWVVWLAGGGWV